jgi:hypothetical protein
VCGLLVLFQSGHNTCEPNDSSKPVIIALLDWGPNPRTSSKPVIIALLDWGPNPRTSGLV